MQEFFLSGFPGSEEVQIIEQESRAFAKLPPERGHLPQSRGLHESRREFLRGDVARPLSALSPQCRIDAFEQMCFAGTDRSVNDQRIGALAGFFHTASAEACATR